MNRVAAKVAKEIFVLLQNRYFHALAREQIAKHDARRSAPHNATGCSQ